MEKYETIIDKYLNLLKEELNDSIKIGKHNNIPDSHFPQDELKKGIEIEKEHTDDPEIAKAIARDHLSECKIYYTLLEKMEKQCKRKE
jgi:hypothetical protein